MERYIRKFEEEKDVNVLVGKFKGMYKNIKQVKNDKDFKKLSYSDKDYVLDELKSDGWK